MKAGIACFIATSYKTGREQARFVGRPVDYVVRIARHSKRQQKEGTQLTLKLRLRKRVV